MVAFFTTDNQIVIISGVRNVHVGNQCWDNNVPDQGGGPPTSGLHSMGLQMEERVFSVASELHVHLGPITSCLKGCIQVYMHSRGHVSRSVLAYIHVVKGCKLILMPTPPPPPPFKATHMHVIFTKFYSPFPTSPKYQY